MKKLSKLLHSYSSGIGIAVGSAAVILGLIFFFIIRRRRKTAAYAKSRGLITPPSSASGTTATTSATTTTTNSSQSIPSYPYSRTDLEKGSSYFGAKVFSCSELEEATDNFNSSKQLGDGGFGAVYLGKKMYRCSRSCTLDLILMSSTYLTLKL